MTRLAVSLAILFGAWLSASAPSAARNQPNGSRPAVGREPISAIIEAFQSHSIVALGEGRHGNEQGHAFRLALIRDPRFAALVNDIVVEFGSSRHQPIMDRFIQGEQVSQQALRLAWQDTTQPHTIWDRQIYEEFFSAVRSVNASLPPERRLRVLLGDPPLDWNRIGSDADWQELVSDSRNRHPFGLIQREVLARKRRALLIYGDMHFVRHSAFYNYERSPVIDGNSIVTLLERSAAQTKVFTIWTNTTADLEKVQSDLTTWARPSLAVLRGTVLGAEDFGFYNPEVMRVSLRNGKPDFANPIPRDQWRSMPMQDQFDAILYLGPISSITISSLSPSVCNDSAYMAMRAKRSAAVGWAQATLIDCNRSVRIRSEVTLERGARRQSSVCGLSLSTYQLVADRTSLEAMVGTDREIRGLRPSGRTLESTRCSLPCLCHRSVTRGPSRASGADQGLAASALRGRAAAVHGR